MNQPEFYVNGSDFPPEDESIVNGSLFHRADGKMMRKVSGSWVLLDSDKEETNE